MTIYAYLWVHTLSSKHLRVDLYDVFHEGMPLPVENPWEQKQSFQVNSRHYNWILGVSVKQQRPAHMHKL